MKTVLISGARGYFGGIACDHFQKNGWAVLRATRRSGDDVRFDLDDPAAFAALRLDRPVDLFIHAAAAHEVTCAQQPYLAASQNVSATLAALDFAVANRIPRFTYVSTFHVFGRPEGLLNEDTVPAPANVYGLTHLQAEACVDMYRRLGKVEGFSVRPANFYGVPASFSDFNRWTLTPLAFPREALELGEIVLKSPGHQRRNFVHVASLCALIEANALAEKPRPLLHAAGSEVLSIRELARLVADVVRHKSGRTVGLKIPEGADTERPFEFTSKWTSPAVAPGMETFLGELVEELIRTSLTGRVTEQ